MELLIQCFNEICLPFEEGNGPKEAKFLQLLEEHGAEYHEKIGIIVPTIGGVEPVKVVVSHMDLIPLFNKGFEKDRRYEIIQDENQEDVIVGALDNTITNAALLLAIQELRENGEAHDVEFVFTEGEEIGFLGMIEYLKQRSKEPFFINLDVTNDNAKKHASIEYDHPNYHVCKQIKDALGKAGFQKERVDDDFDAIKRVGGKGFSYCLPTYKNIHSYKNSTHVSKLEPYYEGLKWLITSLDVSKREFNIIEHSIKKALYHDDYKSFKKAEKKLKKSLEKQREAEEAKRKLQREEWAKSHPKSTYNEHYSGGSQGTLFDDDFYIPGSSRNRYIDRGYGLEKYRDFDDQAPQGFNDGFEYYDDIVTAEDIVDLDMVLNASMVALNDYDIDPDHDDHSYVRKFVANHVFAQDQWTTDDLAAFIGDLDLALKVIIALDDYYLIDTIEEGVYNFVKNSPYA